MLSLDNNHENLVKVLRHFEVVLHVAGPYTFTAGPMLDAVVEAGTHYLDITGENHVIQAQLDRDAEFQQANIMVMPSESLCRRAGISADQLDGSSKWQLHSCGGRPSQSWHDKVCFRNAW